VHVETHTRQSEVPAYNVRTISPESFGSVNEMTRERDEEMRELVTLYGDHVKDDATHRKFVSLCRGRNRNAMLWQFADEIERQPTQS
jgi:hypothetical protein